MRALGASDDEIAEILGDGDDAVPACEIWAENVDTLRLFIACRRQLALGPMGGVLGLRAEGVESVLRMNRVKPADRAQLFDDLQMMGDTAAKVLNRKDD